MSNVLHFLQLHILPHGNSINKQVKLPCFWPVPKHLLVASYRSFLKYCRFLRFKMPVPFKSSFLKTFVLLQKKIGTQRSRIISKLQSLLVPCNICRTRTPQLSRLCVEFVFVLKEAIKNYSSLACLA